MFVFGSRVSVDSDQLAERKRTVTDDRFGRAAITRPPVSELRELGEIKMVSMAHLADAFREMLG